MSRMIHTWRSRAQQRSRFHQTLKELNALSDKEAADLGLNRADFHKTAWTAVYGR